MSNSYTGGRGLEGFTILRKRPLLSTWQSLAIRAAIVLFMMAIALAGHWIDRDGLRDNIDGHISFSDVLYFTAITVTTVGYGDIVPVTQQARMFDTFVVTPIRIFIWLVFLGTAYTFLLQHTWERVRTAMIRRKLSGHTIVCGFGAGGEFAVQELLRSGIPADQIVVIDPDGERIALAIELGVVGITGDATSNMTLTAANVEEAASVLVSTSRDDAAALVVLSARQLNPDVSISASVRAEENEDLLYQAGATFVLNPIRLGGHLLARSSADHNAVDYMADLASADGRVVLRERPARPADVGKRLRDLGDGLGVRLLRGDLRMGFWEADAIVQPGDVIIEIAALTRQDAA